MQDIRSQFRVFSHQKNLTFLDTAASAQKPKSVVDGMKDFYESSYANIHRGSYPLADKATELYEQARKKVAQFIHAKSHREIVITKNATEAINLVARSLADSGFFQKGDRIILSSMEHHANMVPWIQIAQKLALQIEYIHFDEEKNLDHKHLSELLQKPAKLLAITHVSNVLGTINDVKSICKYAKEKGILTLVDGCQAVPHFPVDVQDIDCDFYTFSGHKMYGPTGIGILYGKLEELKKLPPFLGGGDMIHEVFFDSFTPNEVPYKFEAGTPPITEMYGLGLACDFLESLDLEEVFQHDKHLCEYAYKQLKSIPQVKIYSNQNSCGLVSFTIEGINDYDVGDELGEEGICVRVGHHCAQPLMDTMYVSTLIRASFGVYTTQEDIDRLIQCLQEIIKKYT